MLYNRTGATFERLGNADGVGVLERLSAVDGQSLNAVQKKTACGQKNAIGRDFNGLAFIREKKSEMSKRWDLAAQSPLVSSAVGVIVQHEVRPRYLAVCVVPDKIVTKTQ